MGNEKMNEQIQALNVSKEVFLQEVDSKEGRDFFAACDKMVEAGEKLGLKKEHLSTLALRGANMALVHKLSEKLDLMDPETDEKAQKGGAEFEIGKYLEMTAMTLMVMKFGETLLKN